MASLTIKKKSKFHYSETEKKKFSFVYLMLLLPVAHIIIMYFWVNISAITLSFTGYGSNDFTLGNYEGVFNALSNGLDSVGLNPWLSIKNSVFIWFVGNILVPIICWLTTYMLTKHIVGSRLFRVIYSIPGIVGGVVFASVMKSIYSYNGLVISLFDSLGIKLPMQAYEQGLLGNEKTAFATIMIQSAVMGLSGGGMVLAGAFMRIPEEVFESAKLEGCGLFRETFQLAIPCTWPTISTLMVFSLCGVLTSDLSFYMYSNGSGNFGMTSVGFYLYKYQVFFSEGGAQHAYGYLSAFGVCITIITIPFVLFGKWVLNRFWQDVEF